MCSYISAASLVLLVFWSRSKVVHVTSYACPAGGPCPPFTGDPVWDWLVTDMLVSYGWRNASAVDETWKEALEGLTLLKPAGGTLPHLVAVTVGANDLSMDEGELRLMTGWPSFNLVFVEPDPVGLFFLRLRLDDMNKSNLSTRQFQVVEAAVCNETQERAAFYRGTQLKGREGSLSRRFKSLVETRVQCLKPADLLTRVGLTAAQVDVLHLDIEGHDTEILNNFLDLEQFSPAIVKFEWQVLVNDKGDEGRARLEGVLERLSVLGYSIHQDGCNLVAVLASPST